MSGHTNICYDHGLLTLMNKNSTMQLPSLLRVFHALDSTYFVDIERVKKLILTYLLTY